MQVVGRKGATEFAPSEGEEGQGAQVQSGTGFIWDQGGNIVTNNHVVEGTSALMRFIPTSGLNGTFLSFTLSGTCWNGTVSL